MLVIRSSGRVVQGVAALPHRRWLILINDMTTKLTFNSYARMLVCESPWLEISKTRAVVSKTLNQKSGQCRACYCIGRTERSSLIGTAVKQVYREIFETGVHSQAALFVFTATKIRLHVLYSWKPVAD